MSSSAEQSAFEDSYTKQSGKSFFVSVDPVFPDQIAEVVTFIARSRPENVRASYINQFVSAARVAAPTPEAEEEGSEEGAAKKADDSPEVVEAKRKVFKDVLASIKTLRVDTTEPAAYEGYSNLVLALALALFPSSHPDSQAVLLAIVDSISFGITIPQNVRYTALTTLFNSLPADATPALRLAILTRLTNFAAGNDDVEVLSPLLPNIENYLAEWGFSSSSTSPESVDAGNAFVQLLSSALINSGNTSAALSLLLSHLSSAASEPSNSTRELSTKAYVLSLSSPSEFSLSPLSSLPSPSLDSLKTLLSIFLQPKDSLAAFESFAASNGAALTEAGLEKEALKTKLRLLALAELCSTKVGQSVSYEEVAKTLGLEKDQVDDVEIWVIDAIRSNLLTGRLSQPTQSFQITASISPVSFEKEHWSTLQKRLNEWKVAVKGIRATLPKTVAKEEVEAKDE